MELSFFFSTTYFVVCAVIAVVCFLLACFANRFNDTFLTFCFGAILFFLFGLIYIWTGLSLFWSFVLAMVAEYVLLMVVMLVTIVIVSSVLDCRAILKALRGKRK